jgi:hypothetical protein
MLNYLKSISTTNTIIFMFSVASIGLTFLGIMDVKDFLQIAILVIGYKFGKSLPEQKIHAENRSDTFQG